MESTIIKTTRFHLTNKAKEWLIFSICLICIFLFVSTAYSKIIKYDVFYKGLTKVSVIGGLAGSIAWLVPATELLVSVLLIVPITRKWGLYGFTALMILFTGYILSMLLWAEKLPCHCGGAIETLSWIQHVWFNLAFIALSLYALWLSRTKEQ